MRRLRTLRFLAPFLALQLPGVALAGPPEELVQLVVQPGDPSVMAVRYTWGGTGALVTDDGGTTWKELCNSFLFDPATTRSGAIVLASDGTMLVAGFPGMWHDDGHRCGWTAVPEFANENVGAFATDPIDPTITYAVTSSGGQQNGIMRRDGSGQWSAFGTKDDAIISDIRVVPHGSGRRIYLGTQKGVIVSTDGGPTTANNVVRMSDDDGVTWTEHAFGSAGPPGAEWHLQAVDPSNPDRIVASIRRPQDLPAPAVTTDTVFVSSDQGANFSPYLTITEIGGVAFASDGRVWIGDAGSFDPAQPRGVWFATSLDVAATKLSTSKYPVQCLEYREASNTLYACQHASFGTVSTTDGSFTTLLDLRKVPGFVECAGVDMATTCQTQLCGAWCGVGHFAEAPMCCAYSTPTCGPVASPRALCPPKPTKDAGADSGSDASAGGARDAAVREAGRGGGGAGGWTTGAGEGAGAGAGGGAGSGSGNSSEGGCCSVAGRERSGSQSAAAIVAIGAALVFRRRRRRR